MKTESNAATGDVQPYHAARVQELAEAIIKHKRLYYAGHPEISDQAYDRLEDELRRLSPEHPALAAIGSGVASSGGVKIKHDRPMLSLQKTYARDELVAWMGEEVVVGTVKVDGVSLSVIYENGIMTLAKTRGNGQVGEDVTDKIRWVSDVRPRLMQDANGQNFEGRFEIRGELYCTESSFLKLSDAMVALGLERPTSPRNIVAGLLGRKSHVDLARWFNFFAFSVVDYSANLRLQTESEALDWLGMLGFRLPYPKTLKKADEVDAYLEFVKELVESDEVGIDGAVFSYNSFARQHALGNTSHHPRYKMSFKWQGQTAISIIKDVIWATSRLGLVTPVAVIEPVILSGASIANVTLHNAAHVRAYNLKAGDRIEVVRSGEVIPKFLQVIEAAPGTYRWPKACPACDTALVFDDVRLKCPNIASCPAQRLGSILNWIRCAEVDDLSEKRLQHLIDRGLVSTIPDLYRLKLEDFYVIPQTKEKMAAKLYSNIQKSRSLSLARFLNGLGIEGAGLTTWEKLLEAFPGLAALRAANPEQIIAVEGFAAKTAEQIVTGLQQRRGLIDELLAVGVKPDESAVLPANEGGKLSGMTLVITGALSRPRAEVEQAIKAAGGKLTSSVSKSTTAIITDDPTSGSSKMKKARDLGIEVWNEADLWALLVDGAKQ